MLSGEVCACPCVCNPRSRTHPLLGSLHKYTCCNAATEAQRAEHHQVRSPWGTAVRPSAMSERTPTFGSVCRRSASFGSLLWLSSLESSSAMMTSRTLTGRNSKRRITSPAILRMTSISDIRVSVFLKLFLSFFHFVWTLVTLLTMGVFFNYVSKLFI